MPDPVFADTHLHETNSDSPKGWSVTGSVTVDLVKASRNFVRSPLYANMTLRQLAILGVLCDDPGPHQTKSVATALGLSKPTVTRALNALSTLGYLVRSRIERDRRVDDIRITESGREIREALRKV